MDREIVLTVLALVLCGPLLCVGAWWPLPRADGSSARHIEPACWTRMWLPLLPAVIVLAALCGWALREPDNAEPVPFPLLLATLPFAAVWCRAGVRAIRTCGVSPVAVPAGTVGLLRPTAIVSPQLIAVLDGRALAAVGAHEEAHARHCDPLRIWLAQLVTDLQWPSPAAAARLHKWLEALELARDEEARRAGIDGVDLATAILAAARVSAGLARRSAIATLGDKAEALAERIRRLLAPLPQVELVSESRWRLILLGASVVTAMVVGALCGETAVHALLVLVA